MLEFLVHLVITAALLLLVANSVKGFQLNGWGGAFLAALLLGLVNAVLGPIVSFLSLPLTFLTLGLFRFVINAFLLWVTSKITPGFRIDGFAPAFWGALLLWLLNVVISWIIPGGAGA